MDEKAERAAFEAWCQSIGFTTWRSVEGEYLSNYGAELWSGWQARAALAAAPAPASVLAYMAVNREGEVRFTDNAKAAEELERDGWAITSLSQAPAPAPAPLTDERVRDAYMSTNTRTHDQTFAAFRDGVRFAEGAHGIGASTGSKS